MQIKKVKFHAETNKHLFCMVTYTKRVWFRKVELTDMFSLERCCHPTKVCYFSSAYNCRTNETDYYIAKLMVLSKQMEVVL